MLCIVLLGSYIQVSIEALEDRQVRKMVHNRKQTGQEGSREAVDIRGCPLKWVDVTRTPVYTTVETNWMLDKLACLAQTLGSIIGRTASLDPVTICFQVSHRQAISSIFGNSQLMRAVLRAYYTSRFGLIVSSGPQLWAMSPCIWGPPDVSCPFFAPLSTHCDTYSTTTHDYISPNLVTIPSIIIDREESALRSSTS